MPNKDSKCSETVRRKGCWLWIGEERYRIDHLPVDRRCFHAAVRLTKASGKRTGEYSAENYDVSVGPDGWTCECPSFFNSGTCLHINAVKREGVIR